MRRTKVMNLIAELVAEQIEANLLALLDLDFALLEDADERQAD